ncbi:DpnD/PcfM family protein [Selenomonas sp.]|uniref:DpnD/PcfM family protein n=1 Tax=Selenomonas sp. TaxID=2053611 RepID=UPI002A75E868|nr:DpnD/PcfM family protein [Selenomonas sp.]MDY3297130.1 DpnD/PcfM family protein [Selenomonas sp.]
MSQTYTVVITETRKATVNVQAIDAHEAAMLVQYLLDDEKIILTSIDRTDTHIDVIEHPLP